MLATSSRASVAARTIKRSRTGLLRRDEIVRREVAENDHRVQLDVAVVVPRVETERKTIARVAELPARDGACDHADLRLEDETGDRKARDPIGNARRLGEERRVVPRVRVERLRAEQLRRRGRIGALTGKLRTDAADDQAVRADERGDRILAATGQEHVVAE